MSQNPIRIGGIPARLASLVDKFQVAGASLAVMMADEVFETAAGSANRALRIDATPDTVFQIGSITKVLTATLIMQLVEEGRLDLDRPVRDVLPEFRVKSAAASGAITPRQLLTHSSGLMGDFFADTGRGSDCLERYTLMCQSLPQACEPGRYFSYCNAGFSLLGRVVEQLRGESWDYVLRERLLEPLGVSLGTLPEEALLHRIAAGHEIHRETGELRVLPNWALPRSGAPAGATPFGTARDLITFARLHLDGGTTVNGQRVLAEATVAAMQQHQLRVPVPGGATAWGLGWALYDWPGGRVIGHDGGTSGQNSFLRIVPESRVAVALLTNGGDAMSLYREIFSDLLDSLAGVSVPAQLEPSGDVELEPARYAGVYQALGVRAEVHARAGSLELDLQPLEPSITAFPGIAGTLRPLDAANFLLSSGDAPPVPVSFLDVGEQAGLLHTGGRIYPRVA